LHPRGIEVDQNGRVLLAANANVWALTPTSGPPVVSIDSGGVLNAASFSSGPVAPGSIVTLFGSFALNLSDQAVAAPLPSILSGLAVKIQGGSEIAAPLLYM
jgi:hypothetical protein